ncbi:TadE/TadG family type IV pilus assembly protein [Methylobacterium sp. JK268]
MLGFRSLKRDRAGSVALIVAVCFTMLTIAAGAALEFARFEKRRQVLQNAADSAALAAAGELGVAGAEAYIKGLAESTAIDLADPPDKKLISATASVLTDRSQVEVHLTERMKILFADALKMDFATITVTSVAERSRSKRICLLTLDERRSNTLRFHQNATVSASGCGLFANSEGPSSVNIGVGVVVEAGLICARGGVANHGRMVRGVVQSGCPTLRDPLASRRAPRTGRCTKEHLKIDGLYTPEYHLTPGVYCGGLNIYNGANVTLESGIYVIRDGPLIVTLHASITGQNVGFYFEGSGAGIYFGQHSTIDLSAPKDGEMSGLLFFEDRSLGWRPEAAMGGEDKPPPPPPPGSPPMRLYRIRSDNARNLLGTIYLPVGRLLIQSDKPIADRSAYTIIVAQQVDIYDGPTLYLNSDYSSTDIRVPQGLGDAIKAQTTLVR